MGLRFKKKIKLTDNLSLNLSKSGISLTVTNNKGLTYNFNNKGRVRQTITVKGTGISHVKDFKSFKKKTDNE